jgi:hypothetical protein
MSLPQRIDAYPDCFDVFDRALEQGKVRVEFETKTEASIFQLRMCNARKLHRDETKRLYPEKTDPRHNRSPYDPLVVRNPAEDEIGHWWVYIEPHGSNILSIEAA